MMNEIRTKILELRKSLVAIDLKARKEIREVENQIIDLEAELNTVQLEAEIAQLKPQEG